jgi:hypothetical protein
VLDLDKLVGRTVTVRVGGVDYECPCGLDSLTLEAVIAGKAAHKPLLALSNPEAELGEGDAEKIVVFLAKASGIPREKLAMLPLSALTALIKQVLPNSEDAPADPQ